MGRLADDRFGRHRPLRFVPVVFSYWKDDPVADLAGRSARRSSRTSGMSAAPGCRPTGSTRPSRNRLVREHEPAHHARPVRGILPLPVPGARARTIRRPAGPLRQPDRPARQLPDLHPRGRLRRTRRPVQGAYRQRLRQLPAHRLPRPGFGGAGHPGAAGRLQRSARRYRAGHDQGRSRRHGSDELLVPDDNGESGGAHQPPQRPAPGSRHHCSSW